MSIPNLKAASSKTSAVGSTLHYWLTTKNTTAMTRSLSRTVPSVELGLESRI